MGTVLIGPRCNRQVTCDGDPHNDRSESELVANPLDPYNMVGSSKRFTHPLTYEFTLVAYATFDGGITWKESALALPVTINGNAVEHISDPTVTFDNVAPLGSTFGTAYLLGLAYNSNLPPTERLLGMVMYLSLDGGATWSPPNVIHVGHDDKQSMAADLKRSAYRGNIYAAWDDADGVRFARSTDHGASWVGVSLAGVDQPTGSLIMPGALTQISTICVTADEVWVFAIGKWTDKHGITTDAVLFVTSTDGGATFSALPEPAAWGITLLTFGIPFRAQTIPSSCTVGNQNQVVVAWADGRDSDPHIYYRRTNTSGKKWLGSDSGDLLTAQSPSSDPGQADIMPQLASTPAGEVGCSFYEYGPKTVGGLPLIHVELVVSTDGASTFPYRVHATDSPWDPIQDLVIDEFGMGFIGDYFGLAASSLGFFPFWTDTRTGVQEIFTSRLAVNPTDLLLRDSNTDQGEVPSTGWHWTAPDLIVSLESTTPATWVNHDLVRDGHTDHYIYAKVENLGPNTATNVRLSVVVGNWPGPGTEFRYPQDWYGGDWNTPALVNNHLNLGESLAVPSIAVGPTTPVILGPIKWAAADIPVEGTWHPCLLAEVRADNNDSAGGPNGCFLPASLVPCVPGGYFWGNNNVCQRNLSYVPANQLRMMEGMVEFPFMIGNPWSDARFVEVIVERDERMEKVPIRLQLSPPQQSSELAPNTELVAKNSALLSVVVAGQEVAEILAAPGTSWRARCNEYRPGQDGHEATAVGAVKEGSGWRLTHRRSAVGTPIGRGEVLRGLLRFRVQPEEFEKEGGLIRLFQRNDRRVITGSVILQLGHIAEPDTSAMQPSGEPQGRRRVVRQLRPRRGRP